MKKILATTMFLCSMTSYVSLGYAADGDTLIKFTGNIQAQSVGKKSQVYVTCNITDKNKQTITVGNQVIGTANVLGAADDKGVYVGPFTAFVNIPAAAMAQIGTKIGGWKCGASYIPVGGNSQVELASGSQPSLSGNF